MRTQLAEELGLEFPIFAFTHCRDVVAEVSRAGGFGVLGAVGFSPEQLEIELKWIDEHIGDHPYGVDIVLPNHYEGQGELDADSWRVSSETSSRPGTGASPISCSQSTACRSFRPKSDPASCSAGPRPRPDPR